LTPVLWASDGREYVLRYLVPRALEGDALDYYVQAAKGILNGFMIYLGEQAGERDAKLISNRLEVDRIRAAERRLQGLSPEEIKDIAYTLYADPDRYLHTAYPGRYITKISDMKEIIYGAPHSVGKRGFILRGSGFGTAGRGPRFVFGGDGEMWQGSFNIWSFFSNVLGVIFGRRDRFLQASRAEAIVAAVTVFIGFNLFFLFVHALGAPYRKRLFYGRDSGLLIDAVYDRNPFSSGNSYGALVGERQLLKRILSSTQMDERLKKQVMIFKSTTDGHRRVLFDICLCLAPFNPQRALIRNKLHDLLFFLPFLGPYLGRAPWLCSVQNNFHQREAYNSAILSLVTQISAETSPEEMVRAFRKVTQSYRIAAPQPGESAANIFGYFHDTTQMIFEYLPQEKQKYHIHVDLIKDHLPQIQTDSQEFEHLAQYTPGDDIRHIDWKATARYGRRNPLIRRYSRPFGIKLAFWLDMRQIFTERDRRRWARDFVRAVNMFNVLGSENILERLILVLPDGRLHERAVHLRTGKDTFRSAQKICGKIRDILRELGAGRALFHVDGLRFYTDNENRRFLQKVALSDFGRGIKPVQWRPAEGRRLNIMVVGCRQIEPALRRAFVQNDNRLFYP